MTSFNHSFSSLKCGREMESWGMHRTIMDDIHYFYDLLGVKLEF